MIRTKGEPGTGDVDTGSPPYASDECGKSAELRVSMREDELFEAAKAATGSGMNW